MKNTNTYYYKEYLLHYIENLIQNNLVVMQDDITTYNYIKYIKMLVDLRIEIINETSKGTTINVFNSILINTFKNIINEYPTIVKEYNISLLTSLVNALLSIEGISEQDKSLLLLLDEVFSIEITSADKPITT